MEIADDYFKSIKVRNMQTPKMTIDLIVSHSSFKIYLNGNLHLRLPRSTDGFFGVQAWTDGERGAFFIEYSIGSRDILTEYDRIETWKEILSLIDARLCQCHDRSVGGPTTERDVKPASEASR